MSLEYRENPTYQYDITKRKRFPVNQISEPLRINQDDVLTPDEKLAYVACVNFSKTLAVFFLTAFVGGSNAVRQSGPSWALLRPSSIGSGPMCTHAFSGLGLPCRPAARWTLLELQFFKKLQTHEKHRKLFIPICLLQHLCSDFQTNNHHWIFALFLSFFAQMPAFLWNRY